jgi:L-malate glycosyltransferase
MTQRKRLLHVFPTFGVGGQQVRAVQLINHWGDAFEHGIVSSVDSYEAMELIDPSLPVAIVQDYPQMKGQGLWATLRSSGKYLRASNWDLLLTYNWGAMDTCLANRFHGLLPHVHHEDGFGVDEPLGKNWKRQMYRRLALPGADSLIVPSKFLVGVARQRWGFAPPFVIDVPNGVDMALYQRQQAPDVFPALNKKEGDIWIGCISGLRAEKNVGRLVRVAAPLLKTHANVQVVICGTGPEEQKIRALADSLGVTEKVHLMGFQAHPHRYAGLFDILAIPSDTEQFPICEVEAMAAGAVICGTDVGDVKAILPPVNHPYIIPVSDEAGFTVALESLVAAPQLCTEIGKANRQHVATTYEFCKVAERFREIYESAMIKA